MTRLMILNQRVGVAKTTTVHTLARFLADCGKRVLIIDTDPQGSMGSAVPACDGVDVLCSNREIVKSSLVRMSIQRVAVLPVMVDRRLQITEVVSASREELSARTNIPLLPGIRTDTTVTKCSRAKALEDYHNALGTLMDLLGDDQCPQ